MSVLSNPDPMTESSCRSDPDIVSLEIDSENVVVRRRGLSRNTAHLSDFVADQHFRRVRVERRTVDGPILTIVVSQPLVSRKPGTVSVHRFHLVQEVTGKTAVHIEE